jgi:hypothetical protein
MMVRCKAMAQQTMVKVSTDTRDRLKEFAAVRRFRSMNEAIVHLLEEHEAKEGPVK